jgi:CheY-like chemotaxis protein
MMLHLPASRQPCPAAPVSPAQVNPLAPLTPPTTAAPSALTGARILVAEDTEINRQLLRILLARRGCILQEVENGQLALEAIRNGNYDLVLMDCMMPIMDGYQATSEIRSFEQAQAAAHAHHRPDRQRHRRRSPALPRCRHGRLPQQALHPGRPDECRGKVAAAKPRRRKT